MEQESLAVQAMNDMHNRNFDVAVELCFAGKRAVCVGAEGHVRAQAWLDLEDRNGTTYITGYHLHYRGRERSYRTAKMWLKWLSFATFFGTWEDQEVSA